MLYPVSAWGDSLYHGQDNKTMKIKEVKFNTRFSVNTGSSIFQGLGN